jgi:hypothetical protein
MEEDAILVTREQYLEMLIDASCWDASEMESGFMSWCEQHVPTWRRQGYVKCQPFGDSLRGATPISVLGPYGQRFTACLPP